MRRRYKAAGPGLHASRTRFRMLFRLAALLPSTLFVAAPLYVHVPETSIWPSWLVLASFVGTGVYFLMYAVTGQSSVRSAYHAWRR